MFILLLNKLFISKGSKTFVAIHVYKLLTHRMLQDGRTAPSTQVSL